MLKSTLEHVDVFCHRNMLMILVLSRPNGNQGLLVADATMRATYAIAPIQFSYENTAPGSAAILAAFATIS